MKARNLIRNADGTYNIVWFKSYGTNADTDTPPEYGGFPITGRPNLTVKEYPGLVCGFTDIVNNSSTCSFNYARPNLQPFSLIIEANDGEEIEFSFYNTDNPAEIYYSSSFIGYIDLKDKIITNSDELKNITFEIKNSGILTIKSFLLKLYAITHSLKAENYVENEEAVAKSLIQRLAVIKNELWYSINYGLPLFDKVRNKAIIDAAIIKIINGHEGVQNIIEYKSGVEQKNHTYYFTANIATIYNQNISISSEYLI